ncbi:MAG: hypothetical protein KatS3mg076_2515 [Candidatus Binatia bacterium]|nr:MAG: hypothetical protein KatS3mg076_2515 [Candidatus Binatia bacterium]
MRRFFSLPWVQGCVSCKRFLYEGFGRDRWQKPEHVLSALGVRPGMAVADLGAGTGYFTVRFAEAVGPEGVVYAVDVDRAVLEYTKERAERAGHRNVRTVLADASDPRLPPASVDLVFVCNTYHHLKNREEYFRGVKNALRPDGILAVVEYRPRGILHRWFGHGTAPETIRRELEAAGYTLVHEFPALLPRQSFLVFRVAGRDP